MDLALLNDALAVLRVMTVLRAIRGICMVNMYVMMCMAMAMNVRMTVVMMVMMMALMRVIMSVPVSRAALPTDMDVTTLARVQNLDLDAIKHT